MSHASLRRLAFAPLATAVTFAATLVAGCAVASEASRAPEGRTAATRAASTTACTALRDTRPGAPQVYFAPFDEVEAEAECVLDHATREVVVAHYNIRSARMIAKLLELRQRGVAVSVAVDAANAANAWNTGDDALEAAGITVVRTKPAGQAIMHLKVAVIDGAIAMTGSFNWNDTAAHANDENMIVFRDPGVVTRYRDQVLEVMGIRPRAKASPEGAPGVAVYFAPEERLDAPIRRAIDAATTSIDVAMFTFTATTLADALERAAARGVAVRVVTEAKQVELSNVDERLTAAGAQVVKAANRSSEFSAMHHKYAVIDGKHVITGATNWTVSGTRRNEEDLLIIESPSLAQRFATSFADLLHVYAGEDVALPHEAAATAPVFFQAVQTATAPGDRVVVVGSDAALGAWDPWRAAVAETTAEMFPAWSTRARLPVGTRVEYKLVTLRASGAVEWEPGDNRVVDVPATGRAAVVCGVFGASR